MGFSLDIASHMYLKIRNISFPPKTRKDRKSDLYYIPGVHQAATVVWSLLFTSVPIYKVTYVERS